MKTKHNQRKRSLYVYRKPFPNAADPGYFMDKVVDGILSLVSTMGIVTVFLFLATL